SFRPAFEQGSLESVATYEPSAPLRPCGWTCCRSAEWCPRQARYQVDKSGLLEEPGRRNQRERLDRGVLAPGQRPQLVVAGTGEGRGRDRVGPDVRVCLGAGEEAQAQPA